MIDTTLPTPGSSEEALGEMPFFPEVTTDENGEALRMAKFMLFYIAWNLACSNAKSDSLEQTLARLGFTFLERLPMLAAKSAVENRAQSHD